MVISNSHRTAEPSSRGSHYPDDGRSKEKDLVKRKFRIVSLRHPLDTQHPSIRRIMEESQSFHMWFERDQDKQSAEKTGGLSLVFDSAQRAREMYDSVRKLRLGGNLIKLQASKSLARHNSREVDEQDEPTDEDFLLEDPNVFKKIYVYNLLPSTDKEIVAAIFATKGVTDIHVAEDETKPETDGGKMAIVTLGTEDAANDAIGFDGFSIDDEEVSRPMRIVKYTEHLKQLFRKQKQAGTLNQLLDEEEIAKGSPVIGEAIEQESSGKSSKTPLLPSKPVAKAPAKPEDGEISDEEKAGSSNAVDVGRVEQEIGRMMRISRVKWADMCSAGDLWMLLQQVITECGDVAREVLLEGMANCLQRAKHEANAEWLKQHLDELIGEWKKNGADGPKEDTDNAAPAAAPNGDDPAPPDAIPAKIVSSEAGAYVPMGSGKRRPTGKHDATELAGLMGIGALLSEMTGTQPEPRIAKISAKMKSSRSKYRTGSGGTSLRKRGRSRSRGSSSGRSSSRDSNSSSDSRSSGEQKALRKLKNMKSESSTLAKRPRGSRRDPNSYEEPLLTGDALRDASSGAVRPRSSRFDKQPARSNQPPRAGAPTATGGPSAAPAAIPRSAATQPVATPSVSTAAAAVPQNPSQMMMSMMANMMNPAMMMNMMAPNMMTTMQRMMSTMMAPGAAAQQSTTGTSSALTGTNLPAAIAAAPARPAGMMGGGPTGNPSTAAAGQTPNPMALMQQMLQQRQRMAQSAGAASGTPQVKPPAAVGAYQGGSPAMKPTGPAGSRAHPTQQQQQQPPYPSPVSNPGSSGKARVFAPAGSGPYALPISSVPK